MGRGITRAVAFAALLVLAGCGRTEPQGPSPTPEATPPASTEPDSTAPPDESEETDMRVSITVGDSVFNAIFYDRETGRALLAQFPLTVDMADLHRNEKYVYLEEDLPADSAEAPATIRAGEIMCWSGNCLVLFYDTFSNTYGGYVRLGYIEDITGLSEALGPGAVTVTFAHTADE